MPPTPEQLPLNINQTIHGYNNGHRLIASSTSLSSHASRTLLIMSDMSGPSMQPGFESYISGYPLPDSPWYAFAKTWYAPEMERPGCVWTHTLLISNPDLAQIQNLAELCNLFTRPTKTAIFQPAEALVWRPSYPRFPADTSTARDRPAALQEILLALYEKSAQSVFLSALNSRTFESDILSIWSQQWPRLRRTFRFCTGSLSDRSAVGFLFDLQVMPANVSSRHRKDLASGVSLPTNQPAPNLSSWIHPAYADLIAPNQEGLRDFLWKFGADTHSGRDTFQRLVATFNIVNTPLQTQKSLSLFLETIGNLFPNPNEAIHLKTEAFRDLASKEWTDPQPFECALLYSLGTTTSYSAFNTASLNIRTRSQSLVAQKNFSALRLSVDLIESELNPIGEEIVASMFEAFVPADVIQIGDIRRGVDLMILSRRPELAMSCTLWIGHNRQQEFFDAIVRARPLPDDILASVANALIRSDTGNIASDFNSFFGSRSAQLLLAGFNQDASLTPGDINARWQEIIRHYPEEAMEWLSLQDHPRAATISLLASLLNPHARPVATRGSHFWLRFTPIEVISGNHTAHATASAFFLSLGFGNTDSTSVVLVARSFQCVYEAARDDSLGHDAWRWLRDQAPSRAWFREWDKCERLANALVDHFIKFNWPTHAFLEAAASKVSFQQSIQAATESISGRRFLRQLQGDLHNGHISATAFQWEILSRIG